MEPTLLCLASFFKGNEFLRECRRQNCEVILLTREKTLGEAWARESLADFIAIPRGAGPDLYLEAASYVARRRKIDRVVALEEYDVVSAARLREHFCLPGMGVSLMNAFQDKLAMRVRARQSGLLIPEFVHLLNDEEIGDFLGRIAPPWLLKPRRGASAMGIRKLTNAAEVWRTVEELEGRASFHERASQYLLEAYLPGAVYHVDALVEGGRVLFASVERYGAPPLEVAHEGGVATSRTVGRGSADEQALLAENLKLLQSFNFAHGTTHAEFIRCGERWYFLEVAARVGGAYTVETIEAATGVNLWREWARIETATPARPYSAPRARQDYAGLAVSLSRVEHPDTSAYRDPEIVYRVRKPWHVGLVVSSPDEARIATLLDDYTRRFATDFTATAPPEAGPEQYL